MALQVAEISRVLRPGGVFVATTYILDGPYSALPLLKPLRQVGFFNLKKLYPFVRYSTK